MHKHVVPYLPEKGWNDRWYYLTATLFGAFPEHKKGRSMGTAFRPLRRKSESMDARFVALLNAHPDDLSDHLRHSVNLLKANEQPLDWYLLLEDLLQWDSPDRHIQLRWARDFYRVSATNDRSAVDTSEENQSEREIKHNE